MYSELSTRCTGIHDYGRAAVDLIDHDGGHSVPFCFGEFEHLTGECDADSMVVWSEVEPIFQSHCTACHASELEASDRQGAPVGIDYDQAEHARLNSELTWQLIRTGQMPLQGTVPFEDAMMVWEWLSCGGPE